MIIKNIIEELHYHRFLKSGEELNIVNISCERKMLTIYPAISNIRN